MNRLFLSGSAAAATTGSLIETPPFQTGRFDAAAKSPPKRIHAAPAGARECPLAWASGFREFVDDAGEWAPEALDARDADAFVG
jgi:hypothetical protein